MRFVYGDNFIGQRHPQRQHSGRRRKAGDLCCVWSSVFSASTVMVVLQRTAIPKQEYNRDDPAIRCAKCSVNDDARYLICIINNVKYSEAYRSDKT